MFPTRRSRRFVSKGGKGARHGSGGFRAGVDLTWRLDDIKRALWAHFGVGRSAEILELHRRRPGLITPYTLDYAQHGAEAAARVDAATGRALELAVQEQLDRVLARYDALVLPTVGATSFAAGEDYVDTKLVVDGEELDHFSDASLTPAFNICSAHPVVAVPSGWASHGVPTGVQVVAGKWADTTAFRVAAAIERGVRAGCAGDRRPVVA